MSLLESGRSRDRVAATFPEGSLPLRVYPSPLALGLGIRAGRPRSYRSGAQAIQATLKDAGTLIKERSSRRPEAKLDALIAQRPRDPHALFLKGVSNPSWGEPMRQSRSSVR